MYKRRRWKRKVPASNLLHQEVQRALGHRGRVGIGTLASRRSASRASPAARLVWSLGGVLEAKGIDAGYGRCIRVELLKKLHDERKYASLDALRDGIEQDVVDAKAWFAA